MQEADVWINGNKVANHKGGYLPFTVDVSKQIRTDAPNEIIVRVDNRDNPEIPPGKKLDVLDFNLYGGIYRNVHLISTGNVYITDAVHANVTNGGGVLVYFDKVTDSFATGFVKTHVINDSGKEQTVKVKLTFNTAEGKKAVFHSDDVIIQPGGSESINQSITVKNPILWSPENPQLYQVVAEVVQDHISLDQKQFNTGIRSVQIKEDGFFLNGEKRFINGTNRHQEYPYVGYAISDNAQYRDAYKIKQAGFDFVRLSHYPHSEAFMNACDELGLMVMNCIPGWQYYEEGNFAQNSFQDIRDMIRRDRNHPSVVFWENSLNESGMTEEYMINANKILEEEIPYAGVYSAGWIDHESYDIFIPARAHSKAPLYWNDYEKNDRKIFIAEYGDWEYYAQNAGFNQKEFKNLEEEERTSRQLRGDGEKRLLQQALNFQEGFNSNMKGKNTIGHANWVMFDYNRGYANDLEASGISDIFRIPKFSYYFYKSQQAPDKNNFIGPMVYIANYWHKDSTKQVKVFSNCEEVELFINDSLIDRKRAIKDTFSDKISFPPVVFNVDKYTPGTLKAVGFIKGEKVAEYTVATAETPAKINLSYDISGKPLKPGHDDIVFVYAKITDENGNLVPNANNLIKFKVTGEGNEIIGQNPVKAEAGIATALLKISKASSLSIQASAENIKENTLEIF